MNVGAIVPIVRSWFSRLVSPSVTALTTVLPVLPSSSPSVSLALPSTLSGTHDAAVEHFKAVVTAGASQLQDFATVVRQLVLTKTSVSVPLPGLLSLLSTHISQIACFLRTCKPIVEQVCGSATAVDDGYTCGLIFKPHLASPPYPQTSTLLHGILSYARVILIVVRRQVASHGPNGLASALTNTSTRLTVLKLTASASTALDGLKCMVHSCAPAVVEDVTSAVQQVATSVCTPFTSFDNGSSCQLVFRYVTPRFVSYPELVKAPWPHAIEELSVILGVGGIAAVIGFLAASLWSLIYQPSLPHIDYDSLIFDVHPTVAPETPDMPILPSSYPHVAIVRAEQRKLSLLPIVKLTVLLHWIAFMDVKTDQESDAAHTCPLLESSNHVSTSLPTLLPEITIVRPRERKPFVLPFIGNIILGHALALLEEASLEPPRQPPVARRMQDRVAPTSSGIFDSDTVGDNALSVLFNADPQGSGEGGIDIVAPSKMPSISSRLQGLGLILPLPTPNDDKEPSADILNGPRTVSLIDELFHRRPAPDPTSLISPTAGAAANESSLRFSPLEFLDATRSPAQDETPSSTTTSESSPSSSFTSRFGCDWAEEAEDFNNDFLDSPPVFGGQSTLPSPSVDTPEDTVEEHTTVVREAVQHTVVPSLQKSLEAWVQFTQLEGDRSRNLGDYIERVSKKLRRPSPLA